MKIITLSYSDINGGAFRAAYRLHQALLEEGMDSKMYAEKSSSGDPTVYSPPGILSNFLTYCRRGIGDFPPKYLLKTQNPVIHSPAILPSYWPKKLNNSNADIIHLHWINSEMLSIRDIGRIKKPVIWTLHDMWAFCGAEHYTNDNRFRQGYLHENRPAHESGFDLNRWSWNRKRKSWQRPLHIVTPSRWLAECTQQSILMRDWPVTVIPNALDTNVWRPITKEIAKSLLGLPENCPVIAFGAISGSQDTRKGSDLLFTALNYLRGQIPELQLLVFGERRPINMPNIGLPMHYFGHLYDDLSLKVVYSAADLLAVPSRQEAFGQTASEAHACGTPIVAFNIGGLKDIIIHKKNGWLAKAFDTEDFATGIQWILENNDRKQELSKQARTDAVARYSYPVIAKAYKSLYQQLLDTTEKYNP